MINLGDFGALKTKVTTQSSSYTTSNKTKIGEKNIPKRRLRKLSGNYITDRMERKFVDILFKRQLKNEIEWLTAQWVPEMKSQAKVKLPVPRTIETRKHVKQAKK